MRESLLLLLLLATIQSHASAAAKAKDTKKLKLTPPGQQAQTTEDPGSATRLLFEDPRNKNSLTAGADQKGPKVTVSATCTDNMGMIYKQGDPGFEGCQRTFDRAVSPNDEKRNKSVGITIGR